MRRYKRKQNNICIHIDKETIKEAIFECHHKIRKEQDQMHEPTEFLKIPLELMFGAIGIILSFFAIMFPIALFLMWGDVMGSNRALYILFVVMITLLCGVFAILSFNTGRELKYETDKNYIVSYFSAIVSFTALIISLISILK